MQFFRIIFINLISLSMWATPILVNAESNVDLIDNNNNEVSRVELQNENAQKNVTYQGADDKDKAIMSSNSCNQSTIDDDAKDSAMKTARLRREDQLLERFDECLFNEMSEASVLAQRTQEMDSTLGTINETSGFGEIGGEGFNQATYDQMISERNTLINEIQAIRNRTSDACFPTAATAPSFCDGLSQEIPNGCETSTYKEVQNLQRKLKTLDTDLAVLEIRKENADSIANGNNGISDDSRDVITAGVNTLDQLEAWEQAKDNFQIALNEESAARTHLQQTESRCYNSNGDITPECQIEVQDARSAYNTAVQQRIAANAEVRRTYGEAHNRSHGAQRGLSEDSDAAAQASGTASQNTLDSIEANASAYAPFLEKINKVITESNKIYADSMAALNEAKALSEQKRQYTDDYKLYDLMKLDLGSDAVQSKRDVQLLISDLGLMATTSSATSSLSCREIGYNKSTQRIDFRPCDNVGELPEDIDSRMANPNATFKQCYVRSYSLFRAASAMYLAAEINNKTNFNELANECLMECVAMDDLPAKGIDPNTREPNCTTRVNSNDPATEVPGVFVNDGNSQDDKNEQMAALERAANLYGNMVTAAELKSSSKEQALDMFQIAYQAAMEEMTAKTQRVSTAQANLDAARAAKRAADNSFAMIVAAIAGYTVAKNIYSGICPTLYGSWACGLIGVMAGLITSALAYKLLARGMINTATKEIAYWSEELKDAQLHGQMACNYPGLSRNYKFLSSDQIKAPLLRSAIGVARVSNGANPEINLGNPELEDIPAPIFNTAGICVQNCEYNEIYMPPGHDLYDATVGNPDLEFARPQGNIPPPVYDSNGQCTNCNITLDTPDPVYVDGVCTNCGELGLGNIPEYDDEGTCIRNCEEIESILDGTPLENSEEDGVVNSSHQYQDQIFKKLSTEFFLKQVEKYGFFKVIEMVLPPIAHASNINLIDNNNNTDITATSAAHTSSEDKNLGLSLGMNNLNESTDFSYYLAMKLEALKMQTQDNTGTVDLQAMPVSTDHLKNWEGPCDAPIYQNNNDDTDAENNRDARFGCGVEKHLEAFADYRNRNTTTFVIPPPGGYMKELPENTGFPLPETRNVYLMSVINMLQKNLFLHSIRVGDCFSTSINSKGDTVLDSAGSDKDVSPKTICGMAGRYSQLVRHARRQLGLGDVGLDTDFPPLEFKSNGICLKSSNLGNPVPDPICECRQNGSCVNFENPVFGNFSVNMANSGALVTSAVNDALTGNLSGAAVTAGELANQNNATRRSVRETKEEFKDIAFKDKKIKGSKKGNNSIFDEDPFDREKERITVLNNSSLDRSQRRSIASFAENAKNAIEYNKIKKKDAAKKKAKASGSSSAANTLTTNKPSKPGFYVGGDMDLDIDGIALDDELSMDGAIDMSALRGVQAKEDAQSAKLKRSFASERRRKIEKSWGDGVHQNPNSSLFKIISRRYRKTAFPIFMKRRKKR